MRGKILLLIFAVSTLLISVRYFQVQILEHKKHEEVLENSSFVKVSLDAPRGEIFSSDGKVLARNEEILTAQLSGRKVPPMADLEDILGKKRAVDLILGLRVAVDRNEAEKLRKLGVIVRKKIKRVYSGIAPHIVGYVRQGRGVYGVEEEYDEYLRGKPGSEIYAIDVTGKNVGSVLKSPPIPGENITLTIDSRLQKLAEKLLSGKRGTVIVENPKSGEILAMASSPSFDPNLVSSGMSLWKWRELLNDPSGIFINRAISSRYPPGSSIKPFIALAYLMKFDGKDQTVKCKGKYVYRSKSGKVLAVYKDWLLSGHGLVDLKKAIRVSCNVFFYTIGQEIGIDFLSEVASEVKLGDKTGVDLPGEIRGLFPSREWKEKVIGERWYPGDTILLSIGQGYILMTPIEMINFYSLLANEGVSYVPHVVEKIGKRIVHPVEYAKIKLPKKYWEFLREAMVEVTTHPGTLKDEGTAYRVFRGFKIKVAGKTGTAEVPGKRSHSWFIGYAPADDPKVVVLAMVENGGSGSRMAAPIARKMLEKYFSIFPADSGVKSGNEKQR